MKNIIRLKSINIKNIKNVENGTITLNQTIDEDGHVSSANIIGIYGQNGSGKTALVEAMNILKYVISGKELPDNIYNIISSDHSKAKFEFEYYMYINDTFQLVKYIFTLKKEKDLNEKNVVKITDESLFYQILPRIKHSRYKILIEVGAEILPAKLRDYLTHDEGSRIELSLLRNTTEKEYRSIVFSNEFKNKINNKIEFKYILEIIDQLKIYGQRNLVIVENRETGIINADILIPLSFKCKSDSRMSYGKLGLSLNQPNEFKIKEYETVKNIIDQMNIVLKKIIPNLSVIIKDLGSQFNEKSEEVMRFQLFSNNGDNEFPLRYESDGIKKIISILSSLIVVYNDPSYCLVIDELDAGIFEYLLGELLEIVSKFGKGQLIFTSHNLRPLEILDKDSLIFTTTNRKNNYIKITNIKPSNNIRNVYMRNVMLGSDNDEKSLYKDTDNYEIRKAFKKAGSDLNG